MLFMNPEDMLREGLSTGQTIALEGMSKDGTARRARD